MATRPGWLDSSDLPGDSDQRLYFALNLKEGLEAYRLLVALGEGQHSEEAIVEQLGLKSRLPLWSRIEHLEERGMVQILKTVVV